MSKYAVPTESSTSSRKSSRDTGNDIASQNISAVSYRKVSSQDGLTNEAKDLVPQEPGERSLLQGRHDNYELYYSCCSK